MSDAPDRASTGVQPAPLAPGPELLVPGSEGERYQSLSLLALGGFALAVLWAVLVSLGGVAVFADRFPRPFKVLLVLVPVAAVLGAVLARVRRPRRLLAVAGLALCGLGAALGLAGLVAFSGNNPWLLPFWTWAIPLGALLMCWLARSQIRASEGTLSGQPLASWGLVLAIFFGLNYAAYMVSSHFAVTKQASDFARDWLALVQGGELDQAFLLTLPVTTRPANDANLRTNFEARFNAPRSATESGFYSTFLRKDYVRFLRAAGEDTRMDRVDLKWERDKTGYMVRLVYRVSTPQVNFDLKVVLHGIETQGPRGITRQWQIVPAGTEIANPPAPELTEGGKELQDSAGSAAPFLMTWLASLTAGDVDSAYLGTLPPAQRERLSAARKRCRFGTAGLVGVSALPALSSQDEAGRAYLAGRAAFQAGGLLRMDPATFWTSPEFRQEIVAGLKGLFSQATRAAATPGAEPQYLPRYQRLGNEVHLLVPLRIPVGDLGHGRPRFTVEGQVHLAAEAPDGDSFPQSGWRVAAIDLERGLSLPMQGAMPGMGPPGR
jgi:hypothetical protein